MDFKYFPLILKKESSCLLRAKVAAIEFISDFSKLLPKITPVRVGYYA